MHFDGNLGEVLPLVSLILKGIIKFLGSINLLHFDFKNKHAGFDIPHAPVGFCCILSAMVGILGTSDNLCRSVTIKNSKCLLCVRYSFKHFIYIAHLFCTATL